MEATIKEITVLISSITKLEDIYSAELIFENGDTLSFRILEKNIIPEDINEIINHLIVCKVSILKRNFKEERDKKMKFKNSFIITNITKIQN